jgi:hypothetical protein
MGVKIDLMQYPVSQHLDWNGHKDARLPLAVHLPKIFAGLRSRYCARYKRATLLAIVQMKLTGMSHEYSIDKGKQSFKTVW